MRSCPAEWLLTPTALTLPAATASAMNPIKQGIEMRREGKWCWYRSMVLR
jgi:hypothetical protein